MACQTKCVAVRSCTHTGSQVLAPNSRSGWPGSNTLRRCRPISACAPLPEGCSANRVLWFLIHSCGSYRRFRTGALTQWRGLTFDSACGRGELFLARYTGIDRDAKLVALRISEYVPGLAELRPRARLDTSRAKRLQALNLLVKVIDK